jgi:hypothetical protein
MSSAELVADSASKLLRVFLATIMLLVVAGSLLLFYMAISSAEKDIPPVARALMAATPKALPNAEYTRDAVWKADLTFVLFCVMLVPVVLFFVELRRKQGEALLELSAHFVPYGILALSMLFEYKKMKQGEAEGLIALASIMIIFIFAELALFIFTNVRHASYVSKNLEARVTSFESLVRGLPWLKHYVKLSDQGVGRDAVVNAVDELLAEWTALIDSKQDLQRSLLKVFLCQYAHEEIRDVTATLDAASIPPNVIPPIEVRRGRVSYFATNVGFYAAFVKEAIEHIAKDSRAGLVDPEQTPCLAVVTSALPSQFWNWPLDGKEGVLYEPVFKYVQAQRKGATEFALKVFRVVLVGEGTDTPLLWGKEEWFGQREWRFVVDKESSELAKWSYPTPSAMASILVSILEWTQKINNGQAIFKNRQAFLMTSRKGSDEKYEYELVWPYYCKYIHLTRGGEHIGQTQVFAVDKGLFERSLTDSAGGFGGCPDIMFLGACNAKTNDVWKERNPTWAMALMTTMSTQTETMFLTLIHDQKAIYELWGYVKRAKLQLAGPLADSNEVLPVAPGGAPPAGARSPAKSRARTAGRRWRGPNDVGILREV